MQPAEQHGKPSARGGSALSEEKPFIKLIRSPYGTYFYDVNRDAICPVDEGTWQELGIMLRDSRQTSESDQVAELKAAGWLSAHRPTEICNPLTEQMDIRMNRHLSQVNLQVTQNCNLTCIYCPFANNTNPMLSRSHTDKTMTFETAKKAIDFLWERSIDSPRISVCFYGGEPLVNFPLIRQCVEYAEGVFDGKEVLFYITTNATLMPDEVIHYLVDHRFHITFSMDGPKPIHDRHRIRADGSPTYDLVMDTLQKTVVRYGEALGAHVSINMVMNPADSLDDILQWLEQPIFKKIIVMVSFAEDDYLEKKFPMTPDFRAKLTYQTGLSWLSYLGIVNNLKTSVITDTMVTQTSDDALHLIRGGGTLPDVMAPGGPCFSGVRKLFVTTNGTFLPCERVNELSPCMRIGDVDSGFDREQIKKHLNIGQLTQEACRNCWALVHCNTCQREADGGAVLSGAVKNQHCPEVEKNVIHLLRVSLMMQEIRASRLGEAGETQ